MSSVMKCATLVSLASGLNVIQWQDNMILSTGSYLDLTNENVATQISER